MPKPTPDLVMVEKVKQLRKKKLSFRQIAKLLGKDLKNVYLWHSYSLRELSTDDRLPVGK